MLKYDAKRLEHTLMKTSDERLFLQLHPGFRSSKPIVIG